MVQGSSPLDLATQPWNDQVDGDVEELMTLLRLKKEAFSLIFGFFLDYAKQWRTSAEETPAPT